MLELIRRGAYGYKIVGVEMDIHVGRELLLDRGEGLQMYVRRTSECCRSCSTVGHSRFHD